MSSDSPLIHLHSYDLPQDVLEQWQALEQPDVAVDTETAGLNLNRDRLLVVQLSFVRGQAHLIHFPTTNYSAPHLRALLSGSSNSYLFHYGRFDIAQISRWLNITVERVFCTKIASKLVRTYGASHSLLALCQELLGVTLDKQKQTSDWAQSPLSPEQQLYAANDVLYLHQLRDKLTVMLTREGRLDLAIACFAFLPTRADLDRAGFPDEDIFSH